MSTTSSPPSSQHSSPMSGRRQSLAGDDRFGPAASGAALDNFAPIFRPLWMKQVNLARSTVLNQMHNAVIDYSGYVSSLLSSQLLQELEREERESYAALDKLLDASSVRAAPSPVTKPLEIRHPNGSIAANQASPPAAVLSRLDSLPPLTYDTYGLVFAQMLYEEYAARSLDLAAANLYSAKLTPIEPPVPDSAGNVDDAAYHLYSLEARSIREGFPAVDIGDRVQLRQLRPSEQSWQGWTFIASVYSINRAAGKVILRIDALKPRIETLLFNIVWSPQDRIFYASRRALESVQLQLTPSLLSPASMSPIAPGSRKKMRLERWLFPDCDDLQMDAKDAARMKEIAWVDSSLNEEQRRAVLSILFGQRSIPFLLHGPPGTGKTKTLVEACFQILKHYPTTSILVCGASNPSSDTLAIRLRKRLSPDVLFRLNDPSRPFSEIRSELLPYCHIENGRFDIPPISTLLQKRIIVTSCADATILSLARCTNLTLSRMESTLSTTIHPRSSIVIEPHFGFLLVDEAAQAMESELIIPISVVITDESYNSASTFSPVSVRSTHLTICGDSKQLGPNVISAECRAKGFDASLLDRLSQREVYRDHPASRRKRTKTLVVEWDLSTPFVNLLRNYRSATPILMIPSTLFYSETLIPAASSAIQNSPLHTYSRLSSGFPVSFININGRDEPVDENASFWNEEEVGSVKAIILELLREFGGVNGLKASEISVISPFREQVWRIRLALRASYLNDVDVGNVEALQGAENRVVIISTVRSRSQRHLRADRLQHRGLIFEPRRFNVAITRAKELLIVVGNAQTLIVDENWRMFVGLCKRNDSFLGMPLKLPEADVISRLEVAFRATKMRSGREELSTTRTKEEEDEEEFEVLVGSMARQALTESS